MKIAYYEENTYHTEIIGSFLEYFSKINADIVIYNTLDKWSAIEYFQNFCKFTVKPNTELVNEYQSFDKIIIGTYENSSTDDFPRRLLHSDTSTNCSILMDKIKNIDQNKFVYICHLQNDINLNHENIIVLTPINLINPSIKYILPIHNFITDVVPNKNNILTIIGRFKDKNRDTDDLVKLIKNYNHFDFCIHLFSRYKKFVPDVLFKLANEYPNKFKIHLKTKTNILDKHLKNSKYILPLVSKHSCYHKDRLTGNIPLAYNYNVPLIIDKTLQNIYGIENCVSYQNSLTEIIESVTKISEDEYNNLVSKMMEEKKNIISKNITTFNSIIDVNK